MYTLRELVFGAAARASTPNETGTLIAEFDQLQADAQRFAGLRMILTEQDPDKRDAMMQIFDRVTLPAEEVPTDDMVNTVFDNLLQAAAGVRNANG